jgi:hypothetical protein
MHGHKNLKFVNAKQAKEVYQYQNTKRKLYRTTAAIWFNQQNSDAATQFPAPPDDGHVSPKHVERLI